ncbi:MAG: histidinol-phosphate transaminase [Alphaproteobacteria bacterium]|nr:histidinol-phosphate transaminase [Alphaproteobacteria bacterium]
MPLKALKTVLDIEPYKGGESKLAGFAKPIKLASNENPLGCSPAAREAAAAALARTELYPDGAAPELKDAIAHRYGLDPDRIVCGAGSDEIFQLLLRAYVAEGDEIVQSQYAFLMYRIFARPMGAVVRTAANDGLRADVDGLLAQVTDKTRIVFLDNPNNPTGTYLPFEEVRRLHAGLPDSVMLVIDAAYAEYVERNDYSAGVDLVSAFDNVVMTRTFSKVHGLAALRVGWSYCPRPVADALNKVRLPFNVSTPAQAAAAAAMADGAFVDQSLRHNARELARVRDAIRAMGYEVADSVGNFVLVRFASPQAAGAADAHFRKHGYIVRAVGAYGLPDCLRITIGTVEQNTGMLDVLGALPRS